MFKTPSLFLYLSLIFAACMPPDPSREPAPIGKLSTDQRPQVVNKTEVSTTGKTQFPQEAAILCEGIANKVTTEKCEWYASTKECTERPIQKQICSRFADKLNAERPAEIICKVRPSLGVILRATAEKNTSAPDSNKVGDIKQAVDVRVLSTEIVSGYALVRAKGDNGVDVSAYVCNTCDVLAELPYLTCVK